MPSFILRHLDPDFWAKVQAKAAAEGVTVKALILRLLSQWLAACLVVMLTAGCAAPTPIYPDPPPPPPGIVLATQPSELRAFVEPAPIAGGATQVKVFAMGRASDGNLQGVPHLPVTWAATTGRFRSVGAMSEMTDASGLAAIVLEFAKADEAINLGIDIETGGLTSHLALIVAPSSVHIPPGPSGPTGGTGSTGGTGG